MTTNKIYESIQPTRPWQASMKDRLTTGLVLVFALFMATLLVKMTGLSGKLGFFVSFVLIFVALTSGREYRRFGSASAKDALVNTVVAAGTFLTIIPIASIIFEVFSKGYKGIYLGLFTHDMSLNSPNDPANVGGLGHAIIGTLILVAIAL